MCIRYAFLHLATHTSLVKLVSPMPTFELASTLQRFQKQQLKRTLKDTSDIKLLLKMHSPSILF